MFSQPPTLSFAPISVSVKPLVFFSILDHFIRRQDNQQRVIGTLLGIRGENDTNEIEITNCFPVRHSESTDQVAVDMESHHQLYDMHQRLNTKEILVGWYATGNEINDHSTLIHEFYSRETGPSFPCLHILFDTDLHKGCYGIRAFIASPIGINRETEGCLFTELPLEIKFGDGEKTALDVISLSKDKPVTSLFTDMDNLERAIDSIKSMLDRVSSYVDEVVEGNIEGCQEIGRFLMDTLAVVPQIEKSAFEKTFNSHLQDLLMVHYLADLTKTQITLTERLQQLPL